MENLERPNYYAIIPADVRYCKDLTANAKLLYGEITALCNKTGTCWASNKYFANLYGVQPTRISEWVKQLEQAHFVTIRTVNGGQRGIRLGPLLENMGTPSGKAEAPLLEKQKSSTSVTDRGANTTTNNTKNKGSDSVSLEDNNSFPLGPESTARARALLPQLIEIINPKEKPTADRLRVLNGRLKDYTEEEIIGSARAFSKSEWHRKNKQMSVDNLIAPSKFGRWYAQRVEAGSNEVVPDFYEDEDGNHYWRGEKITPENQDRILKERMED